MSGGQINQGRVWRLGADIDTDVLAPGAYMKHGLDVIARHCLESVRPEFAAQVQAGDVIVADQNFGIGSSREQAAGVLTTVKRDQLAREGLLFGCDWVFELDVSGPTHVRTIAVIERRGRAPRATAGSGRPPASASRAATSARSPAAAPGRRRAPACRWLRRARRTVG